MHYWNENFTKRLYTESIACIFFFTKHNLLWFRYCNMVWFIEKDEYVKFHCISREFNDQWLVAKSFQQHLTRWTFLHLFIAFVCETGVNETLEIDISPNHSTSIIHYPLSISIIILLSLTKLKKLKIEYDTLIPMEEWHAFCKIFLTLTLIQDLEYLNNSIEKNQIISIDWFCF